MDVVLRYFSGCPNWRVAADRVREALLVVGVDDAVITLEEVETREDAVRLDFHGSPSIIVNGHDPFAREGAPVGLVCRIYSTESGPQGAPSVRQLAEAMTS